MNTRTSTYTPHNRRKKLLSWLLVLCLCLGLLPTAVWATDAEEQSIPCLNFTIPIPTANSIPSVEVKSATPGLSPAESFDVLWYKDNPDGGGPVPLDIKNHEVTECVSPGTQYYVKIPFDVDEDLFALILTSNAVATINGEQAYFAFSAFMDDHLHYSYFNEAYQNDYAYLDIWIPFQVQKAPEPEPTVYHVKIASSEHGSATATPESGIEGTAVQLKASPEPGYHFKSWSITPSDGAALNGDTLTIC